MATLKEATKIRDALAELIKTNDYYNDVKLPSISEVLDSLEMAENEPAPMYTDDYIY